MDPERWQHIKDLFQSAMDVEPERRSSYLASACGEDTDLRQQVESLLDAESKSDQVLEGPELARRALQNAITLTDPLIGRDFGPYRIERLLGTGGMGTVYCATHSNSQSEPPVAIKMISRGMDTATVIKRFHQEQQILASLDHPNIARLYDGGTSDDGLPYFIMEYVEGQPIDVYCETRRLSTDERLRLFRRVCAAVESAHRKLVVHRDIKPSNILVSENGQPKLLDFGIAKIFNPERGATLTIGTRVMTPDYASPEQVRGERVTPATDVYALGILLYQLLSGHRPYQLQSDSAEELAQVVCRSEPKKPSTYRPLDPALDDIVLKALRKEPGERYQSAAELAADIDAYWAGRPVEASRGSFRYRTRRYFKQHRNALVAVAALLILTVGISIGWIYFAQMDADKETASAAPIRLRPSIAVLGFKNLSNRSEEDWLSTALSEMFVTELAAGGQLRTVRLENVSRLKLEFSIKDAQDLSKEAISRIHKSLGADFLLDGSYLILDQNGQLRVDLRVSDSQEDVVMAVSETGPEADLFTIVSKAGSRLRDELGLSETGPSEVNRARAAFPQSGEAVRLYTEGLGKLRLFDAISALPLLQKAAELDPQRPLVYSAMADAWAKLGYDRKAAETAQKAFELNQNFSRGERLSEDGLSIEGRYRESQKDWAKAIDVYKTLWRFFPDDVEYGLRLATVQVAGGKGNDALTTVQSMRQLPAPTSEDPRIDMAEGDAHGALSDFKRQHEAYAQAEKKTRSSGARLLLASALISEGRALFTLGQTDNAIKALQEARSLYAAAGVKAGIAAALNSLGAAYSEENGIKVAMQSLQQSLAISREIGDRRMMAITINNLGILLKDQRRFAESERMHEEALAIRREIDDKSGAALTLNNLGVLLFEQDQFSEAEQRYQESLQNCRELGDRRGIVRALHNLAIVKKELGELEEAKKSFQESIALRQEIGDNRGRILGLNELAAVQLQEGALSSSKRTIQEALSLSRETKYRLAEAQSLYIMGDINLEEGDFSAARTNHESALAIRKEMHEERTIVESRIALANVALEEERASEAEVIAREIRASLAPDSPTTLMGTIALIEARALLGQKKIVAAAPVVERAKTLLNATQRNYLRTMAEITASRLETAQKQPDRANQHLAGLLPVLQRSNAVQLQFEVRLAQCEAVLQSGQTAATRACSQALETDSASQGFRRVSQRARALVQ